MIAGKVLDLVWLAFVLRQRCAITTSRVHLCALCWVERFVVAIFVAIVLALG